MTSLAFTARRRAADAMAGGASKETQRAIGTGVFGGMITATALAIFFVPVFFVLVVGLVERLPTPRGRCTAARRAAGGGGMICARFPRRAAADRRLFDEPRKLEVPPPHPSRRPIPRRS